MERTKEAVRGLLRAQSTMALATVNAEGEAEVAPVFYVSDDDLCLYWLSAQGTRHGLNVAERPRVAVAIYPAVWAWEDIQGIQTEGEAAAISDADERHRIVAAYRAKFDLPPFFDQLVDSATVYCLRPHWVRWLDNAAGFGHKVEIQL